MIDDGFLKFFEGKFVSLTKSMSQADRDNCRTIIRKELNEVADIEKFIEYAADKHAIIMDFSKILDEWETKKGKPVKELEAEIKEPELTEEEARLQLKEIYDRIIIVLKRYCDLKEEYYSLIALWIMGTYAHKSFVTYPYLFFNAMKGSGKSRTIKLILYLSWNGVMVNSLSEAVLFRTAGQRTLGIDEFEHVASKEKQLLRELLNSAYKRGTCVERAKKSHSIEGDKWEIEKYDVYAPIIMANIYGMDEVLGDRCISLILEKSGNIKITRLLELFDLDNDIQEIKRKFSVVSVVYRLKKNDKMTEWNDYVLNKITTLYTPTTLTTLTTPNYTNQHFFDEIDKSGIDSRHLELFFPLFLIADKIGEEVFNHTIKIAKEIVNEKKTDDVAESRDVMFINFIANSEPYFNSIANDGFVKEKEIFEKFKDWAGYEEKDDEFKWLNCKWIGRALKRHLFIIDKVRHAKGMILKLDFNKARQQAGLFKNEEKVQP